MNAYELAEHLEKANYLGASISATMLRKQADRIAELEKLVEEMKYEKSSGVYDVSSKPVAWINRDEKEGWLNWDKNTNMPINIPLYTHPVKQLSDEEILKNWRWLFGNTNEDVLLEFARAIIKEITE